MLRRKRLLLVGMFVDLLGGGLFAPFFLVYGLRIAHLSLPTAGLILAVVAALGIAVGPVAGAAVDVVGPVRIVVGSSVVAILGCVALLAWPSAGGFALGEFLLSASQRAFYGAFTPFVTAVSGGENLERWFGHLRAARYVGLSLGQAVSGAVLVVGEGFGLRLIVGLDALTFAIGLVFTLAAAAGVSMKAAPTPEDAPYGYGAVIRDRPNVAVFGLNVIQTLLILTPALAMPVFVLEHLHLPTWVPGVLLASGTVTLSAGSLASPFLLRGRRRLRNLQFANAIWVAGFLLVLFSPTALPVALALLLPAMLLLGLGESFYAPTADALPAALAPTHLQGRYSAFHQMAWGVSETIAPAFVGFLLAANATLLWSLLALLAAMSFMGYRALERPLAGRDGTAGVPVRNAVAAQVPPPSAVERDVADIPQATA